MSSIAPDSNTPPGPREASLPDLGLKRGDSAPTGSIRDLPAKPSVLYRAGIWRLGQWLAHHLPERVSFGLARTCATCYWHARQSRREVVVQNLVPVLSGDQAAAKVAARKLFQEFAIKLTDLLRFESGLSIHHLFHDFTGWHHFKAAEARQRGVLLLTLHVGNWEFGAPVLTERGVPLQVITLAEPQRQLTALRQMARAKWGIETLALGGDPFASVEIIRRLEANKTVALLMDRPPSATAVPIQLFDRPFLASISAAELARASGCALLPVYVPRTPQGYVAHILPEIPYHRPALRDRQARVQLTQEIMRVFQPVILHYLTQWYHFVPIWPARPAT